MVALTRAIEQDICPEQLCIVLDRKLGDMRMKLVLRRALAVGDVKQPLSHSDRLFSPSDAAYALPRTRSRIL